MAKKLFDLDRNLPQVMGVLNVTPDSFSDGGQYYRGNRLAVDLCCRRAEEMVNQGATIIDVGGESTRPGAATVSEAEELARVLPVIEAIKALDVVISLDSSSPGVISEAGRLGIGLVNDVRALQRQGAVAAVAKTDLPVCLMHMQGTPQTMQQNPGYHNVLSEVAAFFQERIEVCVEAGIDRNRLLLDPGFGFGKSLSHNVRLLAGLEYFRYFGLPVLVGLSRKSMLVHMLGERKTDRRLAGSLALAVMAVERGAWIVRAHDVEATVDAVKVAATVMKEKEEWKI